MAFKFEQLRVWQTALDISFAVHELTILFPKDEMYILVPQIKRAADSICLNIAEGSTGQSNPEQIKFLGYAIRSAIEVVTCLHIGRKRGIINDEKFNEIYPQIENLIISIQSMRKSLNNK
jgi:four helix bundle protein